MSDDAIEVKSSFSFFMRRTSAISSGSATYLVCKIACCNVGASDVLLNLASNFFVRDRSYRMRELNLVSDITRPSAL
jgi:hypothetical protein